MTRAGDSAVRQDFRSEDDSLLTVEEVAARLRLSRSAVYNLIWRGEIPYVNLGCGKKRTPRIKQSAVRLFVQRRTVQ